MSSLRWQRNSQFVRLSAQKDLFGDLYLVHMKGSVTRRGISTQTTYCHDLDDLRNQVRALARKYREKGYVFFPSGRTKRPG